MHAPVTRLLRALEWYHGAIYLPNQRESLRALHWSVSTVHAKALLNSRWRGCDAISPHTPPRPSSPTIPSRALGPGSVNSYIDLPGPRATSLSLLLFPCVVCSPSRSRLFVLFAYHTLTVRQAELQQYRRLQARVKRIPGDPSS